MTIPFLQALPFHQRRTLQLVYAVKFSVRIAGQRTEGGNKWEGSLVTKNGQRLDARITDPVFVERLEAGYRPLHPCLVSVSLSMPWRHNDWEGDDPCWKLIAAVIELTEEAVDTDRQAIQVKQVEADKSKSQTQTWRCVHTLTGHSPLAISPDGQTIIGCSSDNTVKFWNLHTGELLRTLIIHSTGFSPIAISPDGNTLANISDYDTIQLWNLQTGKLIRTFNDGSMNTWLDYAAFSPDGQLLAGGSGNDESGDTSIKVWALNTRKLIYILAEDDPCNHSSTVFSPDGETLASNGWQDGKWSIKMWSLQSGELIRTLIGYLDGLNDFYHGFDCIAFSPDGKTLAGGSWNGTVMLWNLQSGKLIHTITVHSPIVDSVAFSPDSQTLASGSGSHPAFGNAVEDNTINLWNVGTGNLICTLTGHLEIVNFVAFSPDGQTLVSASVDSTVKIWRVSQLSEDSNKVTIDDIPF